MSLPVSLQQHVNRQTYCKNKGHGSDHPLVAAMSSKSTLRRHFKAQRHLGEAATRSIQNAVACLLYTSDAADE